jgi:hypothetical protein
MGRWNKHQLGLLLCIICFLILGYWIVKPKAVDQPPYLSFSADRDGTKAWRELLEEKQERVKEWRLGWEELPNGSNQLLVAVQPGGLSKAEQGELLGWIEQGNDFILFHQRPAGWELFELEEREAAAKPEPRQIQREGEAGASDLPAIVGTPHRIKSYEGQQVVLSDDQGVLGTRLSIGEGSMTVLLTPEWLMNERITEHAHFELVWPLFGKSWESVWVDETHHGYRTQPGLLAVYPAWLVLASVQLALALLFWLWRRGKRFGPVYTPRAWTVRRGDETLQAVAGWYERLGLRTEALGHQQQLLRQLLWERWGLSPSAGAAEAAQAAHARWPQAQASRLVRLLEQGEHAGGASSSSPAERGDVIAKAFVERTREMGEIIALLEKE